MRDEIELLRDRETHGHGPSPELARQMRAELTQTIAGSQTRSRSTSTRRRLWAAAALAPAAAAAALALTLVGRGDDVAWALAVEVARAAPRLLVGEPGWEITRGDEFSVEEGEMTFSRGERRLELHWSAGTEFAPAVNKRSMEQDALGTITVAGDVARLFSGGGSSDFTAIWLRGGTTIEARELAAGAYAAPPAATLAEFKETVASLREVDVASWLAAMPESVVSPRVAPRRSMRCSPTCRSRTASTRVR